MLVGGRPPDAGSGTKRTKRRGAGMTGRQPESPRRLKGARGSAPRRAEDCRLDRRHPLRQRAGAKPRGKGRHRFS